MASKIPKSLKTLLNFFKDNPDFNVTDFANNRESILLSNQFLNYLDNLDKDIEYRSFCWKRNINTEDEKKLFIFWLILDVLDGKVPNPNRIALRVRIRKEQEII